MPYGVAQECSSERRIVLVNMSERPNVTPCHFKSLREYLDALRDLGDLREVNFEVDTNLEIGAIIRRTPV